MNEIQNYNSQKFKSKHILSVLDFDINEINKIFYTADNMRNLLEFEQKCSVCRNLTLGCLFFEPSTRTSCSFQAAAIKLGGQIIVINDINVSSINKGETLSDTIRCMQSYCDIIVMRHFKKGAIAEAAEVADVPIINAGDGDGEHPTQALLDLYTIQKELGEINGKTITFVGDLKYGRTVHSLLMILINNFNVNINLVSPSNLNLPQKYISFLRERNTQYSSYNSIREALPSTDILYMTRIQKERLPKNENIDISYLNNFKLDKNDMEYAKHKMIVMHPLPRVDEISTDIDNDSRCVYFKQMKYGLYIRMALIYLIQE
tara:strand:- start:475 stop:1428 length:954 start_codon:yes stop_codon:yes gene_type:complete